MGWVLAAVWLLAGAVTVLHALDPHGLAHRSPWSSAVFETTATCAAMLLAAAVFVVGVLAVVAASAGGVTGQTGLPSSEVSVDTGALSVRLLQIVTAVAFALASLGFVRRGIRDADVFYGWLAVTAAL